MVVRKSCWILFPTSITESVFSSCSRVIDEILKKLRIAHSAECPSKIRREKSGPVDDALFVVQLLSLLTCAVVTGERLRCSDISSRQQHTLKSSWVRFSSPRPMFLADCCSARTLTT